MVLMEGLDGRLLVVSAADSRYALHFAKLSDGTMVHVKEDLQQTPEYRKMAAMAATMGNPVAKCPRFYVTKVVSPSGESIDPMKAKLPDVLKLERETITNDYVRYG